MILIHLYNLICLTFLLFEVINLKRIHYNLRKHFFTNRVIHVWNSLPNEVVSADSTNILKSCLDNLV